MDSSSIVSGMASGEQAGMASSEQAGMDSGVVYTAQAASPLVNGEVKLTIRDNALAVTALFDAAEIPYSDINSLTLSNYTVVAATDDGDYVFSRLGNWCQPFYDSLLAAYNEAVLRSFFISGAPIVTAKGQYSFTEDGVSKSAASPVRVYDNCVAALPPDLGARRVPLCFVTGLDKGEYELTLRLENGESHSYSKLGYDTSPFADAVEKQIRKLREESLAVIKDFDPFLSVAQASRIAGIMPLGAAAQLSDLAAIAPSFVMALESAIAETRAAEPYTVFKELCDPERIFVGFRKSFKPEGNVEVITGEESVDSANLSTATAIMLIVPSPNERYAAVEFSESDTATFIYRTGGDFTMFAKQLNRALEAISYKREVIRLSDEELRRSDNSAYIMAIKRTKALHFVRANYAGRVIHSSISSWKQKLSEHWNGY